MSKKNRERRVGDPDVRVSEGGDGGGMNWLPIVLAVAALGMGFMGWTQAKKTNGDLTRRLVDLDSRLLALQTQVANAAKAKPAAQAGPDPNKVYTVKTDGAPTHGNPTAPIVIAEFSDYQ